MGRSPPVARKEGEEGSKAGQTHAWNESKELSAGSPGVPLLPYLQLSRGCFFKLGVRGSGWDESVGGGLHFSGKLVRKKPPKRPELHTGGWRVVVTSHSLGLQDRPRGAQKTPNLMRSSPNHQAWLTQERRRAKPVKSAWLGMRGRSGRVEPLLISVSGNFCKEISEISVCLERMPCLVSDLTATTQVDNFNFE